MPRWMRPRHGLTAAIVLAATLAVLPEREACALITGGEGNRPLTDPGWPKGAAAIINSPVRVAWWEGPPFGGGQWHAECRGDAKVFNAVLTDFARLDVKTKRLIVHDGVGQSFWLNLNREPAKEVAARIDWTVMIWQEASWDRLRQMPVGLNPTDPRDADQGPPAEIEVYTGGNLRWADVKVPEALDVIDQRLEAHGFTTADGVVLEGKVTDLATKGPIAARVRLERVEPQKTGGYQYTMVAETVADAQGRWVLKKAPAGWYRVVVDADGFVPRIVGYAQFDDQPGWSSHDGGLSRPGPVSGRITDDAGRPIVDVVVRLDNVASNDGGRYETPLGYSSKTDADGRFRTDQVPIGKATIWVQKPGYCRPGLGLPIVTPTNDVVVSMLKSAQVRVTVDFHGAARPEGYIVRIAPEGGEVVGSWGGSGNIDDKNQITFEDVPPGRYILQGQPNPSSENEHTEPLPIDLKGVETTEITLRAK